MKLFLFPYFQELRGPATISGLQAGKMTAATWQWYSAMDAAVRGQHSRPLPMVTNVTPTADEVVGTLALSPSVEGDLEGKKKMPNGSEPSPGQLGIPKCTSPQPATAAERKPHNCK